MSLLCLSKNFPKDMKMERILKKDEEYALARIDRFDDTILCLVVVVVVVDVVDVFVVVVVTLSVLFVSVVVDVGVDPF